MNLYIEESRGKGKEEGEEGGGFWGFKGYFREKN